MRASRAIASAAVGACAASIALVVRAQPSPDDVSRVALVSLVWRAPAGCPDEASVRADVARLLEGSHAPVNARADVEHAGDSWRVVVAMNGGERRLEAGSCRAIAEATVLIVAMAVDPARVAANRASQPPALADAGAPRVIADSSPPPVADAGSAIAAATADAFPPVVPTVIAVVPVTAPPSVVDAGAPEDAAVTPSPPLPIAPAPAGLRAAAHGTTFALAAAGTINLGTLPAPGVAPSIALAWTPAPLRLELSFAYVLPDSTQPAPLTGAVERFTMLTGAARACYFVSPASFDLGPCLEAEIASVHGSGLGIAHPSDGSSGWFAGGAGFFGAWRVAPAFAFLGHVDALIPLIRPDFQVDGTTLHRPAFLTGRLSLGAELRF